MATMSRAFPTLLAFLLAGAYATGLLVCSHQEGCKLDTEMRIMDSQMDVSEYLCRNNCGTPNEPRALGCCSGNSSSRRGLREDDQSAIHRRLPCKRYLSSKGKEGLKCESQPTSFVLDEARCFHLLTPSGTVVEEVQCQGHMTGEESIVRCVRDMAGELHVCRSSGMFVGCGKPADGDVAARECQRLMEVEEASAVGGVARRLGGGKHGGSNGYDQVTVINLSDPRYYSARKPNHSSHVPAPLTPLPHNPWSIDNIPEPVTSPVIRTAPLRPVAPTPVMLLDHQLPAEAPRRRLNLVAPNSRPRCTAEGCGPSVAAAPAVVVQRDTVTTVVRETSCPDGMSLEGGVCVGLDLCPVSYTCPRGFVESDSGDCVTESQPLVDCPDRYTLHGGLICTRGTVSQANYVCDTPGYVLDPVSKVCVKEIPQPNTCPPGFTMEVGSCVQKSAPQLRCGPGQTLSPNTRECVSTHTEPAALSCPDGAMQVDGERCVVIQQEAPYCPKRYTLDMATNTCVQSVPKICGECPSGFNRNGRTCERMDRSPAESSCDSAEFELRGELCHKEIVQDSKCPAGTQKSSVNPHVCEKCVPSKPVCDEGTLRGDQCVMEVEQPGKECCAPGFKLEAGQCKRVEVSAPRLSCEGECYTVTSHPVAYACPVDSEFVQHPIQPKCVRQVKNQVCAPVVEPPQCTAEASARGVCSMTAPVAPAPATCSDVLSSDTVPAEPYCPDGGALENGRCVARVPIVPERICDVGTLDEATGQCTRTTVAPIKSECPAGSTRKGFTCVTEEFRPANFVCPDGSEETVAGVCVVRSDAVPLPPKVVKQPPTYSCPMGGVLSGKQCLFSTTVEVPQVCPIGSQEGPAGCYTTAPLVVPPPVEKPVRPSFYCASPYATLAGRQCTVTERQAAEPFCADDSYIQDNKCVRCVPQIENPPKTLTATPKPVCDSPTAELRGCVCIEHDETEPLVSCANGFSLSPAKKCERRTDKTPLCPFGTDLQGEACVRRVEVAPIVRVINGCEVAAAKRPVCYNGY